MREYLIKMYMVENTEPKLRIISEKELFKLIQDNINIPKENRLLYSVYELGDCILDLS